jgi:hypothetical protein
MKFESRFTIPAAMLTLALASTPAFAQQPQPAQPQPSQPPAASQAPAMQSKTALGELVKVDVDKKTLRIKSADDKEMEFRFTAATEVTGESRNVEGLATKTGTKVSVDYQGEGKNMVATKIAIQDADAHGAAPAPAPSPAPEPAPQTAPRP